MKDRKREFSARDPKLYKETGEFISESISKNFAGRGRKPRWKNRKKYYSHPILDKTGKMRDLAENSALHWTHTATYEGTQHINKIISTGYGLHHQYGCGNNPLRAFVKIFIYEKAIIKSFFQKAFHRT
ncbi:MAG: hypothetical protein GY841_13080 [FCB group bacterium]|nr:hypothetical protein [FCB group bacterium]